MPLLVESLLRYFNIIYVLLMNEVTSAVNRFLMRLTKDESEINLTNGEAEPEFSDWKWANPQEVIEQVVVFSSVFFFNIYQTKIAALHLFYFFCLCFLLLGRWI